MSKKIKNEQKKFLGETLNQYDKALNEGINQLDKKNREQNHKISSLVNSFDNEFLEKDVEGNMTTLENSKDGMVIINEIQGNTEVNYCKDGEKELILNGDIDTQGESFVTITEGVDGGLVDVSLEGNTEINLSKTKDPVLVTREFDDINCNVGKLQYTIDDVTTVNDEPGKVDIDRIVGDTMVNHAVNGSEELILNAHINESGDNNITLNGVTSDGGKVDVYLEGNTLVNVSNVKDDYITPTIEDKVDQGSVISLPEVSEGLIHIDEIEGNTLVNYCTDGVKELTLNGDIDVEGTFVTTTEGVDNGLVDMALEGNTLVNLVQNASNVTVEPNLYGTVGVDLNLIKTNTLYTAVVRVKNNTFDKPLRFSGWTLYNGYNADGEAHYRHEPMSSVSKEDRQCFSAGQVGEYKTLIGMSSITSGKDSKITLFTESGATGSATFECLLLEGDWTNKEIPQYFEGMKSVGQDDVNGHKVEIVSTNSDESLSNKKEILLNEPLRSLPNGIKDRFVKIGGKWFIERKCGSAIFDGSDDEGWEKCPDTAWETDTHIAFRINIYDMIINNWSSSSVAILDKFKTIKADGTNYGNSNEFSSTDASYLNIKILKSKLSTQDVVGFKQWLSENPVTGVYQLATPVYEPLEIEPTLNTYNEVNHISNNSIIPCNMKVKNTGYNAIIKPNTLYTVAVDTDKVGTVGINLAGAEVTTTNNVATITTPETLVDDSLRLYGKGIKGSKVRLLEGDKANLILSFFEGIKSSFEDKVQEDGSYKMEILMNNENLLSDDLVASGTDRTTTPHPIYFKKGHTYMFAIENCSVGCQIFLMKHRGYPYAHGENDTGVIQIINGWTDPKDKFIFTAKQSGYFYIQTRGEEKTILQNPKAIVSENINATYTPNKSNKIQLSAIEPLRGVGDVKDRLVFKDGKLMIERNCKQENMSELNFAGDTSNTMKCLILSKSKPKAISNIFSNSRGYESATKGQMYVQERGGGMIYLWIPTDPMSSEEFTNFLNEKNATIVYAMSEPTYEEIPYNLQKIILESYDNGTLFIDTNIPPTKVSFNCFEEELTYLYPSTSYTIQFISDRNTTADITLGGTSLLAQSITKGLNRITVTTPSELVDSKLIINGAGAKISEVVVTDTDREFMYFEGMKSVGECEGNVIEILSQNKNLVQNIALGGINNTTGILTDGDATVRSETHILVKPNTKYTINNDLSYDNYIYEYDINKNFIKLNKGRTNPYIFTTTNNTYYITFRSTGNGEQVDLNVKYQLEEGSTATDYIPHQSNTQQLIHEPLRAVGDVKDRYVLIDNKWYIERNCCEVVLDGSENWSIDINGAIYISLTSWTGLKPKSGTRPITNNIPSSETSSDIINKMWMGNSYLFTINTGGSLSEWLTYLANNPLTVVYQLKTPVYEQIDYNPLETYADITHITTNSAIPCNLTIKNHGYNMVALKENTQYTLYVNKDTTNTLTYRLGDYIEINSPSKFTFTTPETLTDKTLRIDGKGAKVKDLMLIEGTPINDSVGYFDGLKSSYECEQVTDENDVNYGKYKVDIKVVGKNILYPRNTELDYCGLHYSGNGLTTSITGTITATAPNPYLWLDKTAEKIYPHHVYSKQIVTCWSTDTNITLQVVYREVATGKLYYSGGMRQGSVVIPEGYVIYGVRHLPRTIGQVINGTITLQLEEGDTATEYEPYFESKQTIYLNSPLLKGDEIVWKDNKIQHYHKMGRVVLDGSDDEIFGKAYNTNSFYVSINNMSRSGNYINKIYCDKLITTMSYNDFASPDIFGISGYTVLDGYPSENWIYIRVPNIETVAEIKQWLQQNPITVVYELASPYYEEISDYPLKLNVIANSSLSTESTIQVTNISFNIYEETLPYLYPNTKYYITFNADVDRNNIIINLGGNHVVFDCKVGFNKVEITTPSDTTNLLTFSGTGVNIDHVKVTQQDIDEYFEGMKSVGECEDLEVVSANSDNTLSNSQQLNHEPLRAVENVKDRYVLIDNKWYIERNCGGSTVTINKNGVGGDLSYTFSYLHNGQSASSASNTDGKTLIVDNFYGARSLAVADYSSNGDRNTIYFHYTNMDVVPDYAQDILKFKDFIDGKTINLVFVLKTPIYEPINYNPFEVYSDTTHITANSLIPTNVVVKNYGYNCILKPSTKYTIALNKPNGTISAKLGGSAKVDSTNSIFTITTPSTLNDNVLRLSGSGSVKDIMILEGDKTVNTPSYFEGIESGFEQEYDVEKGKYRVTARVVGDGKESSIIFYINEPLRGTGTAKDKVFIQDSKVVVQRNCGSVTLDGSESTWRKYNTSSSIPPTTSFIVDVNNIPMNGYVICEKHNTISLDKMYRGKCGVCAGKSYSNRIYISIDTKILNTQDVNIFKQWLQANPTTVVYQLAEPVYEEADCDLSKLALENYENSSLIFESNIPVSANIRYSGEVPVVTQAKALSSKVDNTTLDINENIIPYMCDIDYRIVELQLMNGDTQGEGIELLGIGDIEILGNENVLFNNRENKKYNYSYDMLKRDILSQRYSKEEYQYRLDRYLLAKKISDEEYKELEGLLNNGE